MPNITVDCSCSPTESVYYNVGSIVSFAPAPVVGSNQVEFTISRVLPQLHALPEEIFESRIVTLPVMGWATVVSGFDHSTDMYGSAYNTELVPMVLTDTGAVTVNQATENLREAMKTLHRYRETSGLRKGLTHQWVLTSKLK